MASFVALNRTFYNSLSDDEDKAILDASRARAFLQTRRSAEWPFLEKALVFFQRMAYNRFAKENKMQKKGARKRAERKLCASTCDLIWVMPT